MKDVATLSPTESRSINMRSSVILIEMFNKTFYKFLLSFVMVVMSVLVLILVIGASTA